MCYNGYNKHWENELMETFNDYLAAIEDSQHNFGLTIMRGVNII